MLIIIITLQKKLKRNTAKATRHPIEKKNMTTLKKHLQIKKSGKSESLTVKTPQILFNVNVMAIKMHD